MNLLVLLRVSRGVRSAPHASALLLPRGGGGLACSVSRALARPTAAVGRAPAAEADPRALTVLILLGLFREDSVVPARVCPLLHANSKPEEAAVG